ncbi:MAG: ABC transporter permease [Alphaproteobacteria bacterium]|nr:MAG: ABC transporter permease [Alphaproteobacteria bacterium]
MLRLDPLQRRRWAAFRANRRALWSLRIFLLLLLVTLPAEFVANDRPILVMYRGELFVPVLRFYPETAFGGEFETEADYRDPAVRCLIRTGGLEACLDDPGGTEADAADGEVAGQPVRRGWLVFPPVPYSFDTVNNVARAPSPPDSRHWLGTDDQTRDVLARVIHGFRISILFAAVVTAISSLMGIAAGAVQGYFGGLLDLFFQRVVEIWNATPALYILIIMGAIFTMNFWLLTLLLAVFGWTALVGVVRAEFLRARNFEYVRAARALGVPDAVIMFRHLLPNAMVATLTMLPFLVTSAIGTLAALDFLGYGLPPSYPSLGELTLQAKNNLQAPWLAFTAFVTFTVMLSILVFIFEGVRDAFDPRKVLR